jgi:hypothetical protein
MSSLPWCYHQIKGDRTHIQARLHWKYGDILRIRPNELSYTSYQAWDDIFVHHPNRPEFPKDPRRQRRNPNKLEVFLLLLLLLLHSLGFLFTDVFFLAHPPAHP